MRERDIANIARDLGIRPAELRRYSSRLRGWIGQVLDWIGGRRSRAPSPPAGEEVPDQVLDMVDGAIGTRSLGRRVPQPPPFNPRPVPQPPPFNPRPPQPPPFNPPGQSPPQPPPFPPRGGSAAAPDPSASEASQWSIRRAPPRPGEPSPYGQEILVQGSSNVYSYSYDARSSTLFVTYLAHTINPAGVRRGRVRRGRGTSAEQLLGARGKTVGQGRGGRGSRYAYFDVPARVFERMRQASSKGKFVWDELRIRGTVFGHKYRYALDQGQVTIGGGVSGTYIPRRATPKGFRSRSVATVGTGRRSFQTSTLPQQDGFRTRSVQARRRRP